MQAMFSLHGTCGLPLCVSAFNRHLTFSKEMADHDLRREAMRKHRSRGREGVQEMGFQRACEILLEEINKKGEADSDELLHDLSYSSLPCVAKAA